MFLRSEHEYIAIDEGWNVDTTGGTALVKAVINTNHMIMGY